MLQNFRLVKVRMTQFGLSTSTSADVIMAERCLICDETVESDRSGVRERGMQGLLRASIARLDGKKN